MSFFRSGKCQVADAITAAFDDHKSGRLVEAEAGYRQILAIAPTNFDALHLLGVLSYQKGDHKEAIHLIGKAIRINNKNPAAFNHLGVAYRALEHYSEAEACYRKAIKLQPESEEAFYNLGNVLVELKRLKEAEKAYRTALRLKPDYAEAYCNLGTVLADLGRPLEAVPICRKALELKPDSLVARTNLLYQLQHMCSWDQYSTKDIDLVRQAVSSRKAGVRAVDPFSFLSFPSTTAEEQKLCAQQWVAGWAGEPTKTFELRQVQKLNIGYLSADFRDHVVARHIVEIIEHHDRDKFTISAYSYGPDDRSVLRKRLEKAFDRFKDIGKDSFEEAARKIYNDKIDILVDLTGHTKNSRSKILAFRPAPIQANFLGYPGTIGSDAVDYIIADDFIIPTGYEEYFSENVIRLPHCYMPNETRHWKVESPSRMDCGLPEKGVVFCCFNHPYKITPEIFEVWCQLLKTVPSSVLWLRAFNAHVEINLKKEAEKRGVAPETLVFDQYVSLEEHFSRLRCADMFLDTTPYNAHATCSDLLWAGVPVVTCSGATFPSRVAGSLLTAVGAPELIAYTLEEYYAIALALATDMEKLKYTRDKIATNVLASPLFDSKRFTRNLEAAYSGMWEKFTGKNEEKK